MIKSRLLNEQLSAYGAVAEIDPAREGEISEDRSAVVGRNNWCFIYEGSNNYRSTYYEVSLAPLGDQWARLIEKRQYLCESLGVTFLQVIVPNKATLMPENYPEPLGAGITTVMQRLLNARPKANLLCPVELMRQSDLREVVFRRNDSHLTVAGNAVLTELILEAVGLKPINVLCIEVSKVNHTGDLGSKFRLPISEVYNAPKFDTGLLNQLKISKTRETIVEGFNGTIQSFYNVNAPYKETVLVIGNSFFERNPSWGLSPIFASLFENYHFIWSPELTEKDIRLFNPTIVISQTCERFLTKTPKY